MSVIKNHFPKCQLTSDKQRLQLTRSIAALLLIANQKIDLSDSPVSLEYDNGMMNAAGIQDRVKSGLKFVRNAVASGYRSLNKKIFGAKWIQHFFSKFFAKKNQSAKSVDKQDNTPQITNTVAAMEGQNNLLQRFRNLFSKLTVAGGQNNLIQRFRGFVSNVFRKNDQVDNIVQDIRLCFKSSSSIDGRKRVVVRVQKLKTPGQLDLVQKLVGTGKEKEWENLAPVMAAVSKPLDVKAAVLDACGDQLKSINEIANPDSRLKQQQVVKDMAVCAHCAKDSGNHSDASKKIDANINQLIRKRANPMTDGMNPQKKEEQDQFYEALAKLTHEAGGPSNIISGDPHNYL